MKSGLSLLLLFITFMIFPQSTDKPISMSAVTDFSTDLRQGKAPNRLPYNPFHVEKEWNALAGDDLNFAFHMASAKGLFRGKAGSYTVILQTLTERDGECAYNVFVNDKAIGLCQKNPPTNEFCVPAMLQWNNVEIPEGAEIRVESNSYSNLRRPEGSFFEYARGRWSGITFIPSDGKKIASSVIEDPEKFPRCRNIGNSPVVAEVKFNVPSMTYYLMSAGTGTGTTNDSFGYLYKESKGNFIIEAGVQLLGLTDKKLSGAGIMVRNSDNPSAPFIACYLNNDRTIKIIYRLKNGGAVIEKPFKIQEAEMLQIERKNDKFIVSAAKFGEVYQRDTTSMPGQNTSLLTGFFLFSGTDSQKDAAAFSNVRFFNEFK